MEMAILDDRQSAKQNIDSALNLIYNMGNMDERCDLHIGHGLAAITSGQTHHDVVAFATPWIDGESEDEAADINTKDTRKIALGNYWQIIQREYENFGETVFKEIVEELDEPFFTDCLVYYFPIGVAAQPLSSPPHAGLPVEELSSSPLIKMDERPVSAADSTMSEVEFYLGSAF